MEHMIGNERKGQSTGSICCYAAMTNFILYIDVLSNPEAPFPYIYVILNTLRLGK